MVWAVLGNTLSRYETISLSAVLVIPIPISTLQASLPSLRTFHSQQGTAEVLLPEWRAFISLLAPAFGHKVSQNRTAET